MGTHVHWDVSSRLCPGTALWPEGWGNKIAVAEAGVAEAAQGPTEHLPIWGPQKGHAAMTRGIRGG